MTEQAHSQFYLKQHVFVVVSLLVENFDF